MSVGTSLLDPLTVYPVRLGGYTTATISGGVIDVFVAADPSPSGWASPEWASLATLFSEFKLHSLQLKIVRNFISSPPAGVGALAVASNLGVATNAGSYAAITDNADVVWYNAFDTSTQGLTFRMSAAGGLGWSSVLTPLAEPYAGAPGCIQMYSNNLLASGSGPLYQIIISGVYMFRCRT